MTDLIIHRINYASIQVESSEDIALEISEAFRFQVPGAKYSPSFKMGTWDGFIRLFNLGSRIMGSGLLNRLIDFAKSREYTYSIVEFDNLPDVSYLDIKEYIDTLDLKTARGRLDIREYQVNGVYTALRERSAILNAATGAGKSLVTYVISRYITEELDGRILIIVPTVGLTTQLKSDFKDYSTGNGYSVDDNVHLISSGADKTIKKKIVISTFQSLKDVRSDWLNSFMCIFTDEGHKITADSFKKIYDKATDVPYRLACTGTVHDTKCNLLQMEAITGPVFEIATAKDLINAGQLVPLKVKGISLNYPVELAKQFKKMEYEDEIKWITTNPKRNNFIKNLAVNCKGTTLVLFRFIEQGKILYEKIKEAVGDTREVYYVDGSIDKDDRELFRLSSNENDAILVFSYATSSTGVNLPSLENVIIAHPIKSRITYLQSVGRGLRLKKGKTHCNLYDIGDNLSYKTHVNTTYEHFGERMTVLSREGHDFTIVNVDFK